MDKSITEVMYLGKIVSSSFYTNIFNDLSELCYYFTAVSDSSFTRTANDDGEYSLDESDKEGEGDTTAVLLSSARSSVNLPATNSTSRPTKPAQKRSAPVQVPPTRNSSVGGNARKKSRTAAGAATAVPAGATGLNVRQKPSINFLNSDKWDKSVRPPFLEDDEVFNAISLEAAAKSIMSWMTTKAMMESNKLKETKTRAIGGKEKPDEEIKLIDIEAGKDDAVSNLHKQRFCFRTPLKEPKEYWNLMPLRWKEVNKSIFLDHVGLDNILSPRTLELLHDRSSPLEIKMFLTMNISVGRSGTARKQNLRTLDDGTTEVVHADDWLSPTNINQLVEALDNLVAAWTVMWPGEWSVVALRRVVTKHLAFGDVQNPDLRKRMLEAFINEVLANNASFASRGKPPMMFEKIDKLSSKFLDNKKHFEKQFKVEQKTPEDSKPKTKFNEVMDLRKSVKGKMTSKGKEPCVFFNSTYGCNNKHSCRFEHSCCAVKEGGKELCGGNHKKFEHK